MFYVLNILQLWTLPTASCLPLINYRMFNQNLEPNAVIYECAASAKIVGLPSQAWRMLGSKLNPRNVEDAKDFTLSDLSLKSYFI